MNTQLEALTNKTLSAIRDRLAIEMNQKNRIATGGAIGSLQVEGNKLVGNSYIMQLVYGRAPGRFPPVQNIRDWVRIKLRVDEKRVNSVAYLIGRKIATEGTAAYRNHSERVDIDAIINDELEKLYLELPQMLVAYAKTFGVGRK